VLDKAEYSAFESTLTLPSYRIYLSIYPSTRVYIKFDSNKNTPSLAKVKIRVYSYCRSVYQMIHEPREL